MKYSSRFFLYAPFGLFLAIALGVGIHWWLAASALSARLAAMNGREIVPGVTMRFASRIIAGFPFSLDTVFRGASFRVDTPHGPTEWRPEEFAMHRMRNAYGPSDAALFPGSAKPLAASSRTKTQSSPPAGGVNWRARILVPPSPSAIALVMVSITCALPVRGSYHQALMALAGIPSKRTSIGLPAAV